MDTTRHNIAIRLIAPLRPQKGSRPTLSAVIERIRQRWRLRLLSEGLLWTISLSAVLILIASWLLNEWHFAPTAIWVLRFTCVFALLALALHFCIKPVRCRVDEVQVALYLEEHEPGLNSIILSAVEARSTQAGDLSPQLVDHLVERAHDALVQVEYGDPVERQKLQLAGARLAIALIVVIGLALWPPGFLRTGAPALLQLWNDASAVSPYRIELAPGDIEIARGDDQLISAMIAGFDGADVLRGGEGDDGGDPTRRGDGVRRPSPRPQAEHRVAGRRLPGRADAEGGRPDFSDQGDAAVRLVRGQFGHRRYGRRIDPCIGAAEGK